MAQRGAERLASVIQERKKLLRIRDVRDNYPVARWPERTLPRDIRFTGMRSGFSVTTLDFKPNKGNEPPAIIFFSYERGTISARRSTSPWHRIILNWLCLEPPVAYEAWGNLVNSEGAFTTYSIPGSERRDTITNDKAFELMAGRLALLNDSNCRWMGDSNR